MTIKDLCETNQCICDIEIEIRKKGLIQHRYRFGQGARYYPGDEVIINFEGKNVKMREITDVDKTEINYHDMDKDYYKMRLNGIPKKYQFLLDMDIASWSVSHAYRGISSYYVSAVCLHIEIETEKEMVVTSEQKEETQLEGQINILDILK